MNDTVYNVDDDMQDDMGYQDEDQDYDQSYDDEPEIRWNMGWNDSQPGPGPMNKGGFNRRNNNGFMNDQYSGAFGNYRGGYGPGGGFGPPRPGMWSRGPGPMGPPGPMMPLFPPGPPGPPYPPRRKSAIHYAMRFLLRCQVPKENLKGLPRQLLEMIKPDYCGLCAQSFDSFDIAKIHYNCKNHLKTQKKFLTQHNKGRNTEMQLKARSLYCELCDVHITSQAHADSHYSGRSHRAVVDGRKAPKNPILLQKGMDGRVAQLIRRERKHMKAVVEPEPEEKAAAVEKSVPPELICEICKTSVTNSEQMTSHLNGKRHLTKEKQHILKMMKGDSDKKNKNDVEVPNEEAAEEGEGEGAEDEVEEAEEQGAPAEEQGDDWGTGEQWEGQTQEGIENKE